jgi:hypothetical protein
MTGSEQAAIISTAIQKGDKKAHGSQLDYSNFEIPPGTHCPLLVRAHCYCLGLTLHGSWALFSGLLVSDSFWIILPFL